MYLCRGCCCCCLSSVRVHALHSLDMLAFARTRQLLSTPCWFDSLMSHLCNLWFIASFFVFLLFCFFYSFFHSFAQSDILRSVCERDDARQFITPVSKKVLLAIKLIIPACPTRLTHRFLTTASSSASPWISRACAPKPRSRSVLDP